MKTPTSWTRGTLADLIASVRGGFSVLCEDRPVVSNEKGVLKTGAVLSGRFDPSQHKFVLEEEHVRLRTPVKAGSIIFCRKNSEDSIGASALVDEDHADLYLSDLLWEIRAKETVELSWLALLLQSDLVRNTVRLWSTGTQSTMKNISQERLLAIPISIPPRAEQRRMMQLIGCWDDANNIHDLMIHRTSSQHASLISRLVFGNNQAAADSPVKTRKHYRWFNLPSEWNCEPIGNLAQEVSERNLGDKEAEILSCSKYDGFVRSLDYFKKQVFSSDLNGYKRIYRGDFGFPSNHVEEGSIGLQDVSDVGLVSPIYIVFRFDSNTVDNEYAHYVLKTSLYRHIFEVSTSASVDRRGSLRWNEFAAIPFPIPPLQEQREIVKILHTSAKRITSLRAQKVLIEEQKRGLMQKLLTGEWRLPC